MAALASLKDIAEIEKLSGTLCAPLFAVACLVQPPLGIVAKVPPALISAVSWILHPGSSFRVLISLSILTLLFGVLCFAFIWCMLFVLALMPLRLGWWKTLLLLWVGLSFLSFGALALFKIDGYDPVPSLNVFWELGCASYGFTILRFFDAIAKHWSSK
jgi:hypothetical protein